MPGDVTSRIPTTQEEHAHEENDDLWPYRELLIGIIERSVVDYFDDEVVTGEQARKLKRSARADADKFFFSVESNDANIPFTFTWIVSHLSDKPEAVISAIRGHLLRSPMKSQVERLKRRTFKQRARYRV